MLYALRVNFENFGQTTKNTIFRLVKLLADLSTRLNCKRTTETNRGRRRIVNKNKTLNS